MFNRIARRCTVGQLILSLLVVMIAIAAINVGTVYHYQSQVSGIDDSIDVAGEQRYTTMQVAFYTDRVANGDEGARDQLAEAVERQDRNLRALRDGGDATRYELEPAPPETHDQLDVHEAEWAALREHAITVIEEPRDSDDFETSRRYVQDNHESFLATAEDTVEAFAAASTTRIAFMQQVLVGLFGVNLLVFAVGGLLARRYVGIVLAEITGAIATIGDGSLETNLSDRTREFSRVYDDATRNEIMGLAAATVRMEAYLDTVVRQAQALARQDFDAPVLDEDVPGEFGDALTEVHRDLTELIETYKSAVENAGHSIYITDADGVIEYVNPAFEEKTGYGAAEAIGSTPALLKSGEHDEAFYADLWGTILGGDVWESEVVNRRNDGEPFVVDQTIAPVLDDEGRPKKFVATNQEITERKERERHLRELHHATRRLVTADDRAAVADLTARAARGILGYDSSVVRLVSDSGTLCPVATTERVDVELGERPEYPIDGDNPAAQAFRRGEPLLFEDVRVVDDEQAREEIKSGMYLPIGEYGVLSITDSVVDAFDQSDVTLASVLAANTETALRRLDREREIKRQNERLEQFGRTVAHDLRNPVQTVEGYLDVAKLAEDPAEAHAEIQVAIDRMAELIDELLELAKQGKTVLAPTPGSLEESATAAWMQVRTEAMELIVDEEAEIYMDDNRVQQLLENLIRNAREHAGGDATVTVGLLDDGFYVEDDGPGIPASHREDIFESGYTTNEDGTGFGLAIVKQIADAHNWSVSVTEGSTGGARFEFGNVTFV